MYNCSRQNFPYLGNRLLAIHQGRSQETIPVFIYRFKAKVTEDPGTKDQLSKESCDDKFSLPTRQPPASLVVDPFQLTLSIQLLHFPQTSGDFSNPKVATIASEITIKGNSLMVSNYWFHFGLSLPLALQWTQPEGSPM